MEGQQPGRRYKSAASRTPRSAILFLAVILGLAALFLALGFASGIWPGIHPILTMVSLVEFCVVAVVMVIWILAARWSGARLESAWTRCSACGAVYPRGTGLFCPRDGSTLRPNRGRTPSPSSDFLLRTSSVDKGPAGSDAYLAGTSSLLPGAVNATYLVVGIILACGGLILTLAELTTRCAYPWDPAVTSGIPTCQETQALTMVGLSVMIFGILLVLMGRSERLAEAPYLRRVQPTPASAVYAGSDQFGRGPVQIACPLCGAHYPAAMMFCPIDGAELPPPA